MMAKGDGPIPKNCVIPTREECFSLMEQHGMLPNIVRHSLLVEKVAVGITHALIASGQVLHIAEIMAAALLHDITKTQSISTHENHAISGENLLKKLGYARIGEIVGCHIEITNMIVNGPIYAEEVVNYADKRVLHETIVSLEERFQDLICRYGLTPEALGRLKKLEKQSYQLEKKIFAGIKFNPESLSLIIGHT